MKMLRRLIEWLNRDDHGNMGAHLDEMTEEEFAEMQEGTHRHLKEVEDRAYRDLNVTNFPWHFLQ